MNDLRTNVDQLNQMILEGKIPDAFEKFYAWKRNFITTNRPGGAVTQ